MAFPCTMPALWYWSHPVQGDGQAGLCHQTWAHVWTPPLLALCQGKLPETLRSDGVGPEMSLQRAF